MNSKKELNNLSGSLKNRFECTIFILEGKISLDADKTSTYNFIKFKINPKYNFNI